MEKRYRDMAEQAAMALEKVRTDNPLVHNITNYVTANDCANAILAVGGSPIMADDPGEAAQITAAAEALVLNMGTPDARKEKAMILAGKRANATGIPVIFDPVGAASSEMRGNMARRLMKEIKIDILRGNLSEISFMAGCQNAKEKGVDVSEKEQGKSLTEVACAAAQKFACVAAVTGPVDVVSDGIRLLKIHNGTRMMSRVTGTGCMTSAVIGAFAGVGKDPFCMAAAGIAVTGIAGEMAFSLAGHKGLGSFRVAFFDALGNVDENRIREMARFEEE